MAKIVVTTGADVVANDGQTSLREAVAKAASGDTITFTNVFNVSLTAGLNIGKDLTIEGGALASNKTNIVGGIAVQAGADVTISHLSFLGSAIGADGANGIDGEAGLSGTDGTNAPHNNTGTNGGKATDGNSGLNGTAAGAAQAALFGIENNGTLTLDHVEISGNATGGDGGDGGRGGTAGSGGHGGGGDYGENGAKGGNGGRGGDGGNAGDGALASNGADAVVGIINTGTLTIKDSLIHGCVATGGDGGDGGRGGNGGIGGQGGSGGSTLPNPPIVAGQPGTGARGGNGGNAGSGANGGNGGDGVAGILNSGAITVVGATILYDNSASGGDLGNGGQRGAVASGGSGGSGGKNFTTNTLASSGKDGIGGVPGVDGLSGVVGSGAAGLVGGAPISGALTFNARHFYEFDQSGFFSPSTVLVGGQGDVVATTITLRAWMIGDTTVDGSVHWRIVSGPGGPTAQDFVGGVLPKGTLDFDSNRPVNFSFQLKPDANAPRDESFTIQLFNPLSGDVLGSARTFVQHVVNVKVTDGNDRVTGTNSNDTVTGLKGNDNVKGGNGDDFLIGNEGNDILDGGRGHDFLTGAAGRDKFDFTTRLAASNVDDISDFSPSDDTIRIDDAVFAGIGALGALVAGKFHIGAKAHDLGDRIIYDDSDGALYFDADGKGGAAQVQFASLDAGLSLTNADFFVI